MPHESDPEVCKKPAVRLVPDGRDDCKLFISLALGVLRYSVLSVQREAINAAEGIGFWQQFFVVQGAKRSLRLTLPEHNNELSWPFLLRK